MYACNTAKVSILFIQSYTLPNSTHTLYIYIRGVFNKFTDFFVQTFKIVVDS